MKKKIFFICSFFIILSFNAISQEEEDNSIDSQFNEIIKSSNTYQSFKVIKISDLGKLQSSIRDSIAYLETAIDSSKTEISEQKSKISSISQQIDVLEADLEEAKKKADTIDFLGVPTHKTLYNSLMWSVIIVLLFISIILLFVYRKGNSNTKKAKEKLVASEIELDNLRKRSLEREQKVRRELQDEINKNRLRKE